MISILIPVYNNEFYLRQCLISVVSQTYDDIQIVLIDDGSQDTSLDICQQFSAQDNRIEVYHQDNCGVSATRNNLLEKAKGDFILFVDSDDWIEDDMVESLLQLAISYDADIVNCRSVINNESCKKDNTVLEIWSKSDAVYNFLRHTDFSGALWNKLIRTSLIQNTKFQSDISYGEDALFCWHLLQRTTKVVLTSSQYYHHRINPYSLSFQKWTPKQQGSGSIVWKAITEETAASWPQYSDIAQARYAIEDMWGLYYASLSHYPYDEEIKCRQKHIKKKFVLMKNSQLLAKNKLIFAWIISRFYGGGRIVRLIRRLKGQH